MTRAVYSMDMPNMKVTKISTGRPELFTAKQTPLTAEDRKQLQVPGGGYRIDLEIKPGLPLGRFSDTLVIETDHPLQKETKVSIHGYHDRADQRRARQVVDEGSERNRRRNPQSELAGARGQGGQVRCCAEARR